jgi:hypothetical protein
LFKEAIDDCQFALTLDPKYQKAYLCLAFGNFYLQNYEKTFEDLESVSRLQIGNTALHIDLQKAKEFINLQKDLTTR